MKTSKQLTFLLFFTVLGLSMTIGESRAQEISDTLRLEEAIALSLEENYDIRRAVKSRQIATANVHPGEAGFLPRVWLSGNYNYSVADTRTEFANPDQPAIDASGASTINYGAGVNVAYTIFSGGSRNYTYQKLETAAQLADLQERQAMESTILSVISSYMDAVSRYDAWQNTLESVDISRQRYERAKESYGFGAMTRLELLNAEVDLSNDSVLMVQAKAAFAKAQIALNQVMGIDPGAAYAVSSDFSFEESLDPEMQLSLAREQNVSFLLSEQRLENSRLDWSMTTASSLPRLDLTGGYSFSNTNYDANFLSSNESLGWNAGLTLSFDLFDGGKKRRARENALIQIEAEELAMEQAQDQIRANVLSSFEDYESSLSLIRQREQNVKLAERNFARSEEAFATGQITGLELREAQLNLINARYNLSLQRIQAKLAATRIHFYAGTIIR